MSTYREVLDWIKKQHGLAVKTCWIAHAKEILGLETKRAPNRRDISKRLHPCPPEKLPIIESAFKHFGMI